MSKASREKKKKLGKEYKIHQGKCKHCQKTFPMDKLIFGPDPYQAEVNKQYNPKFYLCERCHDKAGEDI